MENNSRYRVGQRWAFQPSVPESETSLVIGEVTTAGQDRSPGEPRFEIYVRYSQSARASLPSNYDGVIINISASELDQTVTELLESGVVLPWWWIYGREFADESQAPHSNSVVMCPRISDVVTFLYQQSKEKLEKARERKAVIDRHRAKFAAVKPRPKSKSVAESWGRIDAWLAEHAAGLKESPAPGASAQAIADFEQAIHAQLPDDFKESLRLHNGGRWWVPPFYGDLLSLDEILEQWKMYSEWQANGEYATGDDWTADHIQGPIKPVFWNQRRIHVTDNSGDHLTLDLDPPADGAYGQLFFHSHEVGPQELVASSWTDFLAKLVEELESGKYVFLAQNDSITSCEELEKNLEL